jgi:uncharacterized repeat protein (TIGR04138 family)
MKNDEPKTLQELSASTGYPVDAFHFVRRGLDETIRRKHSDPESVPESQRHVNGRQLSLGLREFAVRQYGHLARTVLHRWGIRRTEDFGRIVFAMVDGGLMSANESDTPADFDSVYPFDEAFEIKIHLGRVLQNRRSLDKVEKD